MMALRLEKVGRCLAFLSMAVLCACLLGVASLPARELHVPQDYRTIQEAIDAARPGDVILVEPGTYVENLRIDVRELAIRGTDPDASKVVIRAKFPEEPVVLIRERDVRLSNLTLTGGLRGIEIESRADNPSLVNLILRDNSAQGLFVEGIRGGELMKSIVKGNKAAGVFIGSRATLRLERNKITGNYDGVETLDATLEVRTNLIRGNIRCGLNVDEKSEVSGKDNAIFGNGQDLCGAAQGRDDLLDKSPPPAPRNLSVMPSEWSNQGRFVIDWEDPSDVAGIAAFWFKVGKEPTAPDDGTRREINAKPLVIENPPEGEQPIFVWLEDGMRNFDHRYSAQGILRFDQTPPVITPILTPEPNEHGWNNSEVTVRFQCRDELSGVESCTPTEPVRLTEEGKDQPVEARARDRAGNVATVVVKVSIDMTKPTIQPGELQGELGREGWYRSDVTVPYTAQDNLSGFLNGKLTTEGSTSTSGEGADRTALIRVSDLAGNGAELTVGPFKVDKTPPTLRILLDPSRPNGRKGWYTRPVKVTYKCHDPLSGLDPQTPCPPATTLSNDGVHKLSLGPIRDLAGNVAEQVTAEVKLDQTPPEVRCQPPDPSRWYREDVKVPCMAQDATSGLASSADANFTLGARGEGEAVSTGTRSIADRAGNTTRVGPYTFKIDKTPPTIEAKPSRPPDANGWYNHDVTVRFKCEDRLSGIASCTSPITVRSEGRDRVIQGEAVDEAGNRATATAKISLDKTPPTGSLTINDGVAKTQCTTVTLRIGAEDNLSGVSEMRFSNDGRTWSGWEPFGQTREWDLTHFGGSSAEGLKTVHAQVRDRAGNVSAAFSAQITYSLLPIRVPQDVRSIQEAIRVARPGGVIEVAAGTYTENLKIGKSLTLRGAGAGKTVIKGAQEGQAVVDIWGSENEVILERLTITGSKYSGLHVVGSACVSLRDSEVSSNGRYGLYVGGRGRVTLRNSKVSDNGEVGLRVWYESHVSLQNSQVSGNSTGLEVLFFAHVSLQDSQVSGNENFALEVYNYAQITLQDSQILGNGRSGLRVWDSARVSLRDSQVSRNRGCGLEVWGSARAILGNCRVSGNGVHGLYVTGSARVSLRDSQVSGNGMTGLDLNHSARAEVVNNKFLDNAFYGINADCPDNIVVCLGNIFSGNSPEACNYAAEQKCR